MEIKNLIKKITVIRTKQGLNYENMGDELKITGPGYRKIETGETKLTVERLFQISEILKTPLEELLEIGRNVFNQTNNENTTGYQQQIAHFYQENKEVYEKLLESKDAQIALLRAIVEKNEYK